MLLRWRGPRRRDAKAAAPSPLRPVAVEAQHDADVAVWAVSGEIDIATKPGLEQMLDAVDAGSGPMLLDLSEVTFMDSTGLAVLMRIDRAALAAGRPLAIVCPEGPARLLFAVTGVEEQLPLHATRDAALAALA